ncbi:MAG: family 4 glycosyl hydrolase [Planctomycetota bacterium]|jgi:alpha-galactosidase
MKVVMIGAGSRSFGPSMIRDLLVADELKGKGVKVHLVDTDEEALNGASAFAEKLKAAVGSDISFDATTERREALGAADYVIVSVARKRMELWEQDFRVPLAHGFRHCLGENGGPGSVFHALRSFELVVPMCRDVEELCPDAMVLSFTNPEMKVLHAILTLTKAKAAGLCHGVFGAVNALARILGVPAERLEVTSAGMNHFYAVLKVIDRRSGEDRLDEAKQAILAGKANYLPPLFRKMLEVFDVFTFPSDDHIGEYVSYAEEFLGVKWHYGREDRKVELEPSRPQQHWADAFVAGRFEAEKLLKPSGELAVPIICDIEHDRGEFREAVNVLNSPAYIDNLPPTCVVEVPAVADAAGIHPQKVGRLPEPFAEMIRRQATICDVLTEAYRMRSRKLLLQALLLDPIVNGAAAAEKMLDEMLELQKDFLPEMS